MTDEPFWDELGIAWQAATPALDVPLDRMKTHFRRESGFLRAALAAMILFATAAVALAGFTFWQAWRLTSWNFGTRGLAITILSAIVWVIVATLWPVRGSDEARSLSDFAALGLARARRGLRTAVLGFVACGLAGIFGFIGLAIRTSAGHPPALSPAAYLAFLALCAIAVELDRRRLRRQQARFAYLSDALRQAE